MCIIKVTGAGGDGAGQSLSSSGSCLQKYIPVPFFECHGQGTCNFYATGLSFWLMQIAPEKQFVKPTSASYTVTDKWVISRCQVCIRSVEWFLQKHKETSGDSNLGQYREHSSYTGR